MTFVLFVVIFISLLILTTKQLVNEHNFRFLLVLLGFLVFAKELLLLGEEIILVFSLSGLFIIIFFQVRNYLLLEFLNQTAVIRNQYSQLFLSKIENLEILIKAHNYTNWLEEQIYAVINYVFEEILQKIKEIEKTTFSLGEHFVLADLKQLLEQELNFLQACYLAKIDLLCESEDFQISRFETSYV